VNKGRPLPKRVCRKKKKKTVKLSIVSQEDRFASFENAKAFQQTWGGGGFMGKPKVCERRVLLSESNVDT